jgi:hypothetical protein
MAGTGTSSSAGGETGSSLGAPAARELVKKEVDWIGNDDPVAARASACDAPVERGKLFAFVAPFDCIDRNRDISSAE